MPLPSNEPPLSLARIQRKFDLLMILFFVAILAIPLALTVLQEKSGLTEKRITAPIPDPDLALQDPLAFASEVEVFFNDHFGMRRELINLRNTIEILIFRKSPISDVIIGEDDWLYYTGDQTSEDFAGRLLMGPEELERWRNMITHRRDWLADRGITYLFLIAPNKQTIYPEHLPFYAQQRGVTRAMQLAEYFRGTDIEANVLFAADPLLLAKNEATLFLLRDSHWNYYGAHVAFQAVMDRLRYLSKEEFDDVKLTHGDFIKVPAEGGDLANMIGDVHVSSGAYKVSNSRLSKVMPAEFDVLNNTQSTLAYESATDYPENITGQRLLFFHDSFGGSIAQQFFSTSFAHARYSNRIPTNEEFYRYVEMERPTVVIEQRVERLLSLPIPD